MAEKIIYDIKFEGLENAKNGLRELTQQQIDQQTAIKETQKAIKDYEKELKSLQDEVSKNGSATQEQIAREQELSTALNQQRLTLSDQKDELKGINSARNAAAKEAELYNTYLNAEVGSNDQLKAQLAILTKRYNGLSEEQRSGSEEGQKLTAQIKGITDKLKENESAIGDNRRNVGNYEEAVTNALGKVNIYGVNLGEVTTKIKEGIEAGKSLIAATLQQAAAATTAATATEVEAAAKAAETTAETANTATTAANTSAKSANVAATTASAAATKGATAASGGFSNALKILRIALISTGIGAIVIALGALVGAFLSTQRGADALSRVITPIKFVLQGLLGVLQDLSFILGSKVVKGFNDISKLSAGEIFQKIGDSIKQNLLNRLEAFSVLGKAIVKVLSGDLKQGFKELGDGVIQVTTGIENGTDKIGNAANAVGGFLEDVAEKTKLSAQQGLEYANAVIALEEAQIKLKPALAEINKQLALNRLAASDQLATDEDRIKALEESIKLSNQSVEIEKNLIQQQIDLAVLKTKQNHTDRAAYQEIADLQARKIDLDAKALTEQKRIFSQLTGLQKKQQDEEEKRLQKLSEITQLEEERLIKERDTQLESLKLNKDVTKLTKLELQARTKIYEDYYDALAKKKFKTIQKQLKDQQDYNDRITLENEQWYYEQLVLLGNNEEAKKKLQDEYAKKNLDIRKNEIQAQLQIIESQLNQLTASNELGIAESILTDEQKEELKKRLQELQTELAKINYEYGQIGKDPETGEKQTLGSLLGMDEEQIQKAQQGYAMAMQGIQDIIGIANENIQLKTQERIDEVDKALQAGTISEQEAENKKKDIQKEAFENQKKTQKASATVNYLQGLISTIANAAQYPFPASVIIGALQADILTGVYATNIKKINAQKFEKGGMIKGKSHKNGGVPFSVNGQLGFEAEGGEFIQKKKAVDYYGVDFMNAINNMKIPKLFQEGGFVTPSPLKSPQQQITQGIAPIVQSIAQQQIEVINVESKFTKTQNQVKNVEQAATY